MSAPRLAVTHYERARNWAIGSDPGLLRLRMASRTTIALASAMVILYLVLTAAGQSLTVAGLAVVVAMVSAQAVNEPDPRAHKITMALLPVPAVLAITASTWLAPHQLAVDIVFVMVMFGAVYARRYGARARALGVVAVMTYFITLFLGATTAELPWMIVAVVVGTLCSLVMSHYLLPDRPERVLRHAMRSLRARMVSVIDTAAEALQSGWFEERRQRRLRIRIARLNETALMVQNQIEDKVDPATVWLGVDGAELAPRVFDAELTVERIARAGARAAAVAADIPAATRAELIEALRQLARALRVPQSDGLRRATVLAQGLVDLRSDLTSVEVRRLAMAILDTAAADSEIRSLLRRAATGNTEIGASRPWPKPAGGASEPHTPNHGLRPTTRQAIQVAIATSLTIVVGGLVSPERWYWAAIAAYVTFVGTTSRGETLTKGWQQLLGALLGMPCGVLIAMAVSGNTAVSVALIFVCLFCALYLTKVAYGWMIFWITAMLALLYGLLGQFSVGLLLVRIEEIAIGAVIGVTVAVLVLPARTRTSIRNDVCDFLTTLADLIDISVRTMFGAGATTSPTEKARQLDRKLQQFRTTAKPVLAGVGGPAGRRSIRRGLRLLSACDHYARALARHSEGDDYRGIPPKLADVVTEAAAQTRRNIDALAATLNRCQPAAVLPTTDLLDSADTIVRQQGAHIGRLRGVSHALRQIDRAVVDAAVDLGAGDIKLW